MERVINCGNIRIATVNGTGSQSSNQILIKSIFRMGIPVSGKNLFPSNIFGLPTWYGIRFNQKGYVSFSEEVDLVVAMNNDTISKDIELLSSGGLLVYNEDLKFDRVLLREDSISFGVPFKTLVSEITESVKLRKLLTNMVYVGVLAKICSIDMEIVKSVVGDFFKSKQSIVDINIKAIEAGYNYASEKFEGEFYLELKSATLDPDKILIDGNTAAGLGAVFGGCSFGAWYPITPSSSLMESFESYSNLLKVKNGLKEFAVVQAEDELSSIGMVIGAGWAGARAMTATSGPGLSLMNEFVGLSYFAEVPSVIWDVQRVGPSTGLPTRTQQADLRMAYSMGHGDGKHPVLLPAFPDECFDFAKISLDLAEELQTFVCVLSDLDIGMNHWMSQSFEYPLDSMKRGKLLDAESLESLSEYKRYQDIDGDGVPYRTLPGTQSNKGAFFTRGTGHDESSKYTEDSKTYEKLMLRLKKKELLARELVPKPIVDLKEGARVGIVAYGSTHQAIAEVKNTLRERGIELSYMRLRALPVGKEVRAFIHSHEKTLIIEQNRDGQLREILSSELPDLAFRLESVLSFDGLPVRAMDLVNKIENTIG